MFCFQCEQTAKGTGCTGACGVCGKQCDTADFQDELTGAMAALARVCREKGAPEGVFDLFKEGLFVTVTNVNFDNDSIRREAAKVREQTEKLAPGTKDYDMKRLWSADEDIRSLKSLILFGLRGMAAYAYHAKMLGYSDEKVDRFFAEGLAAVADESTAAASVDEVDQSDISSKPASAVRIKLGLQLRAPHFFERTSF